MCHVRQSIYLLNVSQLRDTISSIHHYLELFALPKLN